jgi:hypothetical protein
MPPGREGVHLSRPGRLFWERSMPREPKWTNETTKRVAHGLLKLCQPAAKPSDQEPIDWQQVIKWLEAQRDAAIRKRDGKRKAPRKG